MTCRDLYEPHIFFDTFSITISFPTQLSISEVLQYLDLTLVWDLRVE